MPFKIYTKTGDAGETALFGGRRVLKSDLRVDAYGTVDELNAFAGHLRDQLASEELRQFIAAIQHRLFSLGAHLAADPQKMPIDPDLQHTDIQLLEQAMDAMDEHLPELRNFILPGGHPHVSLCHVCRTVCRRAERLVVALHHHEPLNLLALQYLNRLSDYFFVLARFIAWQYQVEELKWVKR